MLWHIKVKISICEGAGVGSRAVLDDKPKNLWYNHASGSRPRGA